MMAAEIKPYSDNPNAIKMLTTEKPVLDSKIECSDEVYAVQILSEGRSVLSICNDKSVRIWQRRASGQFWPSVCHYLPAAPTSLHFSDGSRRLCLGLTNGTVMEFEVSADENSLHHHRDYLSHQARVTGVLFSGQNSWLLSVSRDKFFCFHNSSTGHRLGGHESSSWCTSLEFDEPSCHAFVGDYNGCINMLKLDSGGCTLITTLKGHTSCVQSLTWDAVAQQLYSGSHDTTVRVWDVGGGKGVAYELQGHTSRVRCLYHSPQRRLLVSGGEDGIIVWWDLTTNRLVSPTWNESDSCQLCDRPFYWNVRAMINQKQLGLRQHHCRKCGKALCDLCSSKRTTLPALGFEFSVRVCDKCYASVTDKDREPMAVFQEAKHTVMAMDVDLKTGVLLTVGTDNVIKVWDVKPLLN